MSSSVSPPLRLAAGVIPVRGQQVYLVQRSRKGSFFPGFHAFPGGGYEPEDESLAHCALRELFEEAGLWLGERVPSGPERRALLARETTLVQLLQDHPVDWGRLLPAGVRITPDYSSVRFEAHFFILEVGPGLSGEIWPGELEGGEWWDIEDAWRAFECSEIFLAAPTQSALRHLRNLPDRLQAAEALRSDDPLTGDYIPVVPGLGYVPLVTPTLPPARHTLCYLVEAEGGPWLVDPGSDDPAQCARLEQLLEGRSVQGVLFTHHHPDHVGGYEWAKERCYRVLAHPNTAALLGWIGVEEVGEGYCLTPEWVVLYTPGHASGHVCVWNSVRKILLAADLVSSLSTILVHPPDGSMKDYLASLERCRLLEPRLVLPCHGPPLGPGSDLLGRTLRHRLERESHILQALKPQPQSVKELVDSSYADTPASLHGIARWSLLAHLVKLQAEGRAKEVGTLWQAVEPEGPVPEGPKDVPNG